MEPSEQENIPALDVGASPNARFTGAVRGVNRRFTAAALIFAGYCTEQEEEQKKRRGNVYCLQVKNYVRRRRFGGERETQNASVSVGQYSTVNWKLENSLLFCS